MPHIILEYTKNLNIDNLEPLLYAIHKALSHSCEMDIKLFKSRAYPLETYCLADNDSQHALVCITLFFLEGKAKEFNKKAANTTYEIVKDYFNSAKEITTEYCIRVEPLYKDRYFKYL